jgi:hypothetical protein
LNRLPPLHCPQALEAVARRGTVVDAAEELHVTPSAISHRLRPLATLVRRGRIAAARAVDRSASAPPRSRR